MLYLYILKTVQSLYCYTQSLRDGKQKLGRPWHNSPRAVYIHTTMRIPLAPEGWTNMGAIPGLFAEYDSRDAEGNVLDLSQRKTEYDGRGPDNPPKGSCRATITKEEADGYVYERIIPGDDGWNPRAMMEKLPSPAKLKKKGDKVSWKAVPAAAGYVIFNNDRVIGFAKEPIYTLPSEVKGNLKVCAVQGKANPVRNRECSLVKNRRISLFPKNKFSCCKRGSWAMSGFY